MPWQPSDARRAGRWGGPRRGRPPWWPENEPFPPQGPEAWRRMRRRFLWRAGGAALVFVLLMVAVVAALTWAASGLLGHAVTGIAPVVIVVILLAILLRGLVRGFRYTAAPLGELIEASGRVESGQLGIQVPERGPREVRQLARSFNAMSERLARTEAQRRRLLADVSHELRTPLTVIQGNVEGMLDGLYPADRDHLERVQAEARHLEQLIEDLRTLSLAESGGLPLHREPTDLGEIARRAVAGFEPQASAAGVGLVAEVADGIPELELDQKRMHQVIANLVSNALRHTPRGGEVRVSVHARGDGVTLGVADSGSGMEPDAAAQAFERFWRAGEGAGAGLGLAIVRDLVMAHGGNVSLESRPGVGTSVWVRIPTSASPG